MPKLPDGVGTGRSPIDGDKNIGGLLGKMDANGPRNHGSSVKNLPTGSHPGKGNGSGDVGSGSPLRPSGGKG